MTYYGAMLDALWEALGTDCVIYVQSIPDRCAPRRPPSAPPGLTITSAVLNEQLAQLADSKGCVYLAVGGPGRRRGAT